MVAESVESVDGSKPTNRRRKRTARALVAAGGLIVLLGALEVGLQWVGVGDTVFTPLSDRP